MCDSGERGRGWKGWTGPERSPGAGKGDWIDLSYPLGGRTPRASVFPEPEFRRVKSLPSDPLNVTELRMVVHVGTHVDAPRHFFSDGPAFHEIPLARLCGPGVVLRIDAAPLEQLGARRLAEAGPEIRPGDIVALDTGWSAHAGTPMYDRHPCLTEEAARWLVERGVKLVACDFTTPDLPVEHRPPGFAWPVHHALLGHGVLVCENLTGHRALAGRRAEFLFLAPGLEGSDGAPARVAARPLED